ncbi:MFS general substrate transporter [Amniculicola lignicola CBS 123094]|uniref:MFS general substrate transporter n=1 Tax=Amniculicola lignicola CBS 123094 TaxID=1392246 RepID=A0A6A5WCF5_9PLEO|nr:MFS general substrate transporter [Amniculicola lignicola CBS 123094]
MLEIIREAPIGQGIRFLSRNTLLPYPEEEPDFQLPAQYAELLDPQNETKLKGNDSPLIVSDQSDNELAIEHSKTRDDEDVDIEMLGRTKSAASTQSMPYGFDRMRAEQALAMERTKSIPVAPQKTLEGLVLVDWYTTDDPANPQNWSSIKKSFIVIILCLYTCTVYCAGPIYAASSEGIIEHFGVSPVAASLGLSLYVLAYGIGDVLFSPLSEIPIIGRNHVYYLTFIVFWVLAFPTAIIDSFSGLLALRFWMGFFGSPALANGGATIGDMFSLIYIPYGLSWWVFSAWCGPAFGPLIGGFAAMAKGWRWPLWEVVWMASPVLVILLFLMPETSAATILLRRARRLRKLTGEPRLQSQSEIDQRNMSASKILSTALIRPMEIMLKDPSIFFVNLYTGYFYGVFYTFFEVFPLVFPPFYGFNLGQTGLAFLSCLVGVIIALLIYFAYLHWYMIPDNLKGFREQENRLVPAIIGSFLLPIGLFMFAWTARSSIHWSVPLIGVSIFCIGHFWVMQSLFTYLPFSYPKYAASLFAGNSIWRSGTAGASIVFARPLFINLGVHKGVTLLAGLSLAGIAGTIAIYTFGKRLRARSKFAQS